MVDPSQWATLHHVLVVYCDFVIGGSSKWALVESSIAIYSRPKCFNLPFIYGHSLNKVLIPVPISMRPHIGAS